MSMISYSEHQRLVKEASLGYEKRLAELRADNDALKARVAELESAAAAPALEPPRAEAKPEVGDQRGRGRRG